MSECNITASCGCKVSSCDDLVPVEYDDFHCDAVDGFVPVVVYATFCLACAEGLGSTNRLNKESQP